MSHRLPGVDVPKTWPEWFLRVILYLISFLIMLVILPFFLPISLIFRIYRNVLSSRIKKHMGEDVMMVDGHDAMWLQDTRGNRATINAMMKLNGEPSVQQWRQVLSERLVYIKDKDTGERLVPKSTRYPTKIMHRYVWVEEENFNIDDHVFEYEGPSPSNRKEMQQIVGEICSEDLPLKKSQWQYILVKPSDPKAGYYYVVFRVHHSIADGISLVKLLMTTVVDVSPKVPQPKTFGSKTNKILRLLLAIYKGPGLMAERMAWQGDQHILHGPQPSGQKIVAWSDTIDLALVKRIKNATGCTVNDVLISCLALAMQEYFKKHSAKPPRDVLAYVPVDIRPASEKLKLDNQFSLVFCYLPTSSDGQIQALIETKRRMDRIKTSPEPIVASLLMKYCMARLPNWLTTKTFNWFSAKCTMVLSNVPGPQEKVSIGGNQVEEMIFWPPQRNNVGMGVSILSYGGKVSMGILVDKVLMTNPELIVKSFSENFYDLASQLKLS